MEENHSEQKDEKEHDIENKDNEPAKPKKTHCWGPFFYGTKPEHLMPYEKQFYLDHKDDLKTEVFAGITVAFAQVSESVAFAFIAGLGPLFGLHAAWIIGLCTSLFGSRPGMINGATGVRAAVIAPYVKTLGIGYVFYIILLISAFQTLFGVTRLAQLITLVPRTVMLGFVNGLAIILAMGQLGQFQHPIRPKAVLVNSTNATAVDDLGGQFLPINTVIYMWVIIAITVAVIVLLPMWEKTKSLPSAIIGILAATVIEHTLFRLAIGIETPTIGSVSDVSGGFPKLFFLDPQWEGQIPPLNLDTFQQAVTPAFIAAAAGAVECVLTMEVVNDFTGTGNDSPNQQLYALSLGNFISGLFGTMGGGATIGLSVINCMNGASGYFRISGVIASMLVLIFILALSFLIQAIPTASLVGLMVVVCFNTFDWQSLWMIIASSFPLRIREKYGILEAKINRSDALTIVVVTVVTLTNDLFQAVMAGVLFTGVVYAWQAGLSICAHAYLTDNNHKKVYKIKGPLFFGSAHRFQKLFNIKDDPNEIEIDFNSDAAKIYDFSGFNALSIVCEKYKKAGKNVKIIKLDKRSRRRLSKAKLLGDFTYDDEIDKDIQAVQLSPVQNSERGSAKPEIERAA